METLHTLPQVIFTLKQLLTVLATLTHGLPCSYKLLIQSKSFRPTLISVIYLQITYMSTQSHAFPRVMDARKATFLFFFYFLINLTQQRSDLNNFYFSWNRTTPHLFPSLQTQKLSLQNFCIHFTDNKELPPNKKSPWSQAPSWIGYIKFRLFQKLFSIEP